jgi:hypothetical protein
VYPFIFMYIYSYIYDPSSVSWEESTGYLVALCSAL